MSREKISKMSHLEDFDSTKGDIEKGSLAGTTGSTLRTQPLPQVGEPVAAAQPPYDDIDPIQRGIMNAQQHNTSSRSPGEFMDDILNSGGYSVTTGKLMNDNEDAYDDTFTFDGSTITSANDITHKKFQRQQQVVQMAEGYEGNPNQYPPIKPNPSHGTASTSGSWGTDRSNKSRVEAICCGLGRLGVILSSVAMTAVAVAVILWLVLGYLPNQQSGSGSLNSACCKGQFEPNMSGREICNAANACCVVCANSIVGNEDSIITEPETVPALPEPIDTATTLPPLTAETEETPEPSSLEQVQSDTSAPTSASPSPSQANTSSPTTLAPTSSPSTEPTSAPSASPTVDTTPCCETYRWGDFPDRRRCSETDPEDCCKVCVDV